jgi:hypothetical protein
MCQPHISGIGAVDELIQARKMVGVQVTESQKQFQIFGYTPVPSAPRINALVDHCPQIPIGAELSEALIEKQNAVVTKIEMQKRSLIAVGLVFAQKNRMLVVPVNLHGRVLIVHA